MALLCVTVLASPVQGASPAGEKGAGYHVVEGIIVPPMTRDETASLVDGGIVETRGYGSMILTLSGGTDTDLDAVGLLGAVLVPDVHPFDAILEEYGVLAYPVDVTAEARAGGPGLYLSRQTTSRIAFPRYRVYFYNSTGVAARAYLHVYLTR